MKIFFNPRRRQDGGIWLIAFVVIGTAVVAGVVVWMMHHWKVKLDEYQRRRDQAATNESSQLFTPPGVTNIVVIDKKHWWEYDTNNDTASVVSLLGVDALVGSPLSVTPPVEEARILHPVLTIGLSNNTLVFLLLTNDGLWATSSVPIMDRYGAPNPELESGPPPVCDTYFFLERTVDLKVWKEVIRMGASSNSPSMFRDTDVGWGDPHVFYRTRQD